MSDPLEVAELQSSLANADSFLGTVAERAGDYAEAMARFGAQIARMATLVQADPRAGVMKQRLASAFGLQADVMAIFGQRAAAQAIANIQVPVAQNRANENNLGDYASACVLAGTIAERAGDHDAAQSHWQQALAILSPRLRDSNHWRLLDPAARALALLGRDDESRALIARLEPLKFQPLEPWPESVR